MQAFLKHYATSLLRNLIVVLKILNKLFCYICFIPINRYNRMRSQLFALAAITPWHLG